MASVQTAVTIAAVGVAIQTWDDVKTGYSPFYHLFFSGILIVILAGIGQFQPDMAAILAFLFLLSVLFGKATAKKGK